MTKHYILKTPGNSYVEREQYWENVITKARAYPAGVTQFCRDYQIRKDNYYQWFKRLKLRHPEWGERVPTPPPKKKGSRAEFVPVIVKNEQADEAIEEVPKAQKLKVAHEPIEIRISEELIIVVPPKADPDMFRLLLQELIVTDD